MKTALTLLFIFFIGITVSFTQVTVKNGTSVYVTNEIVYVKGNIELTTATDNITLRNEAQFIQGEPATTTNTGLGFISVFQEGDANAYHYNYWSSPVGNTSNTVINNPYSLTLLRDGDATSANFGGLSAFTTSLEGTWSPLTISTKWMYVFAGTAWSAISQSDAIAVGNGFTLKGTDNSGTNNGAGVTLQGQRYEFRGKPNSGDITVATTVNEHYLLGNPYSSALDADQFILDNAAVIKDNTLYFWDQWGASSHYSSDYEGNYATYMSAGLGLGVAVAATTSLITGSANPSVKVPKRYIPIAQGFFIDADATGTVTFKNTQRPKDILGLVSFQDTYKESATSGGSVFLKSAKANQQKTTSTNRIHYYLGNKMTFPTLVFNIKINEQFNRHLLLLLRPDADETVQEGKEAQMYDELSSDAFWAIDDKKYSIQSDAFFEDKRIPLGMKANTDSEFVVSIEANEYNAPTDVYLYDTVTETEYSLATAQNISLSAGNYIDRFEIRFKSSTLSIDNTIFTDFDTYYNSLSKELVVVNPTFLEIKKVTIFDVVGKQIYVKKVVKTEESQPKQHFSVQNVPSGIYIVKVTSKNNGIFTKKLHLN